MAQRVERYTFPGARGAALAARLVRPPGAPRAWALVSHGFTSSKDLVSIHRICRSMAACGIAAMAFDFTGLGESGGGFADTTFTTNVEDIVCAGGFMRAALAPPALLVGHSLGGAAMITAAERMPEARAVAVIGAPDDTRHLHDLLLALAPGLAGAPEATVLIAGRPVRLRRALLEDLRTPAYRRARTSLALPLLVLHSPEDELVDFAHARRIVAQAPGPARLVALEGMDHLMLRRRDDGLRVGEWIAQWALPHIAAA